VHGFQHFIIEVAHVGAALVTAPHPAAATRILIVEDETELVRALRINLRARQYDVLAGRHCCLASRSPGFMLVAR